MRKTIFVLAVLALVCIPVLAQTTASVRGKVTDPQSEALAGASVTVINVETGFDRSTTTNASGSFSISELPVGTYVVTIEAEGF